MNVKFKFLPKFNFWKRFAQLGNATTHQLHALLRAKTHTNSLHHLISMFTSLKYKTYILKLNKRNRLFWWPHKNRPSRFFTTSQSSWIVLESLGHGHDLPIVLDSLGHGHDLTRPGQDPGRDGELKASCQGGQAPCPGQNKTRWGAQGQLTSGPRTWRPTMEWIHEHSARHLTTVNNVTTYDGFRSSMEFS